LLLLDLEFSLPDCLSGALLLFFQPLLFGCLGSLFALPLLILLEPACMLQALPCRFRGCGLDDLYLGRYFRCLERG